MYNSVMVLYFVNSYLSTQLPPEYMLDTNCRTDYNKLRHLILIDKNFGKNASIIQEIITQGETVGRIKESFPAVEIEIIYRGIRVKNLKKISYHNHGV